MNEIHRQALRFIQQDSWDAAHRLIQDRNDALSCRIHACLHRIEGDLPNAEYWYARAGIEFPEQTPEEELIELLSRYPLT